MSSRTKKSFVWLWAAALLTATVGVSVQQIYCYCAGKASVSFWTMQPDCAKEERAGVSDCCPKPEARAVPSCCEDNDDGCASNAHKGCMEKSIRVFKLKTEFVVEKPFDKKLDCPKWIEKMPMFRQFFRPVVCLLAPAVEPSPPSLSGRDISLRLRVFRC